jgi:hypothetical protein
VDKFVPMLPHKSDDSAIVQSLLAATENRINAIAADYGIDSGSVLRVAFWDMSCTGAPTAPVLALCESAAGAVAGQLGLTLIVCSDTPSGRGRTKVSSPGPKGSASSATAAIAVGAVGGDAGTALPPAPSEYHVYADRGATRALLVADLQKVMKIGYTVESRYPEPVTFRFGR